MSTQVKARNYGGEEIVDLDSYLTPMRDSYADGGAVEEAHDLAKKACNAVGGILAALVERKLLTLRDAMSIAGVYDAEAEIVE